MTVPTASKALALLQAVRGIECSMKTKQSESRLDQTVNEILRDAAGKIAEAVRQELRDRLAHVLEGPGLAGGPAVRRGRPPGVRAERAAKRRPRAKVLCPVPGCGKPGAGPKYGWFCKEHASLPDGEKLKYRAARRVKPSGEVPAPEPKAVKPKAKRRVRKKAAAKK